MKSLTLPLLSAFILGALPFQAVRGQPHTFDDVRKTVTIVVGRGINVEQGNTEVTSQGTGFFINSDGFLVTSYHLKAQLGAGVAPGSINYQVHFGNFEPGVPAKSLVEIPEADIMILYVPVGGRNVNVLKPASKSTGKLKVATTPVYAAGFAAGYDYSVTPGTITSFVAPIKPLTVGWTTNVPYPAGMSGAPLVLNDGRVIAVVKAAEGDGSAVGIVVPILHIPPQFWEESATPSFAAGAVETAGDTRLVVTANVVSDRAREVSKSINLVKRPCDTGGEKVQRIQATPGWTIDPASVTLVMTSAVGGVRSSGVRIRDNAIEAYADLAPAGQCVRIFGDRKEIGIATFYKAELRYSEKPDLPVAQNIIIADAAAVPGLKVAIPGGATDLEYRLKLATGEVIDVAKKDVRTQQQGLGQKVVDVGATVARASPF